MPQARNPALEIIDSAFPLEIRGLIPPALRRAYSNVSRAIETVEFLGTPSGYFQRGDLIVLAAEYEFAKLVKNGSLAGFDMAWDSYAVPTGKHLVMRNAEAYVTISQVPSIDARPRDAVFRRNLGVTNTAFLFPEMDAEAKREGGRKHLLILHGYHNLTLAAVALPHPSEARLLARTDNLMLGGAEDFGPQAGPEGPTDSPDPEAIDAIVRIVRDSE